VECLTIFDYSMCSFEGVDSIQCNIFDIFICTDRIIIVMVINIECYSFLFSGISFMLQLLEESTRISSNKKIDESVVINITN
jgi:hypothetical protein